MNQSEPVHVERFGRVFCLKIGYFGKKSGKTENKNRQHIDLQRIGGPIGWCWEESNCRHMDFQSIALPSELQHHRLGLQR